MAIDLEVLTNRFEVVSVLPDSKIGNMMVATGEVGKY